MVSTKFGISVEPLYSGWPPLVNDIMAVIQGCVALQGVGYYGSLCSHVQSGPELVAVIRGGC